MQMAAWSEHFQRGRGALVRVEDHGLSMMVFLSACWILMKGLLAWPGACVSRECFQSYSYQEAVSSVVIRNKRHRGILYIVC